MSHKNNNYGNKIVSLQAQLDREHAANTPLRKKISAQSEEIMKLQTTLHDFEIVYKNHQDTAIQTNGRISRNLADLTGFSQSQTTLLEWLKNGHWWSFIIRRKIAKYYASK